MTTTDRIAVLGLGRMGSAIATRLTEHRWDVTGWTRSGQGVADVENLSDPSEAVAKADIVLLALFDGMACRQVLDRVRDAVPAHAIVINTSTIGPDEAAELAQRLGKSYVHAPVLGSTPAVASGVLEILAAGGDEALDRVRPVLEALGTVLRIPDAATSAALKLVANASLAGAALTLRDVLQQADALGVSRADVLDVLQRGVLGGLVARKREFLAAPQPTPPMAKADFTIGALAKDMAMLAAASNKPLPSAAALATAPAGPEADIGLVATAPAVDDAVLEPLRAYIRGHATGDPVHFRDAFLPTAHIEGIRDGAFVSWTLDKYCGLFDGKPASDEPTRARRIDSVVVDGTVATASMTLWHGDDTFTDVFLLIKSEGRWRIANKAYHRHR